MNKKASFRAKVVGDGKVTIPDEVRETEDIDIGDYVDVDIEKIEKEVDINGKN